MQEIGCIPCIIEGEKRGRDRRRTPGQVNHLLSGYRLGHDFTVMECPWHHVGDCFPGWDAKRMRKSCGPSRALNKKAFHNRYGSDIELCMRQNDELRKLERKIV